MKNRGKKSHLNSEISKNEKKNTKLNENDTITHRIIQYFDDPKEARALAKIREVSQGAKMNSNESLPRININLDSIQNGVYSLQRVLGVVQDFSNGKKEEVKEEYKPRPLYKHFDD